MARAGREAATLGRLAGAVNGERRHGDAEDGLEIDTAREQLPVGAGRADERHAAREPGTCARPGGERDPGGTQE